MEFWDRITWGWEWGREMRSKGLKQDERTVICLGSCVCVGVCVGGIRRCVVSALFCSCLCCAAGVCEESMSSVYRPVSSSRISTAYLRQRCQVYTLNMQKCSDILFNQIIFRGLVGAFQKHERDCDRRMWVTESLKWVINCL